MQALRMTLASVVLCCATACGASRSADMADSSVETIGATEFSAEPWYAEPPDEAVSACRQLSEVDPCSYADRDTPITGLCQHTADGVLACRADQPVPGRAWASSK